MGIVPNSPTLWRISGKEAPQMAASTSILNVSASFKVVTLHAIVIPSQMTEVWIILQLFNVPAH